jgi:hypothetical protein
VSVDLSVPLWTLPCGLGAGIQRARKGAGHSSRHIKPFFARDSVLNGTVLPPLLVVTRASAFSNSPLWAQGPHSVTLYH